MPVEYTLQLFPSDDAFDMMVGYLKGENLTLSNDNAGVDMFCSKETVCPLGKVTLLDLGVKARMLDSTGATCNFWLAPRSSIWKNGVTQANSIGVIDRSYRGPLMGAVIPFQYSPVTIAQGSRLFQVLAPDLGYISKVEVLRESTLDSTARGEGGFGSTGL